MSDQYTPGPWHVENRTVYDQHGSPLLRGPVATFTREDAANLRLAAAAPDLLDVCSEIAAVYDSPSTYGEMDIAEGVGRVMDRLRAALAKARGEVKP